MTPEISVPVPLALLVIVDNSPDAEDNIYVMHGEVHAEPEGAVWHGAEGRFFPLDSDWPSRLKPVSDSLRELFSDAPEFLTVVIRSLAYADSEVIPLGWNR